MICPRKMMIKTLNEREAKYPNGYRRPGEIGRERVERRMGVTCNKHVEWWSHFGMISLAHTRALSSTFQEHPKWTRKEGELKAIEIPYWGRAADIAGVFNRGVEEEERSACA